MIGVVCFVVGFAVVMQTGLHYLAKVERLTVESAELSTATVDARIADLERAFGESS